MAKKYAIIDQINNGDNFEEIFDTEAEAIARADYEWSVMSPYDKDRRDFYTVFAGEVVTISDEDFGDYSYFELDGAEIIKSYKG